MAFFNLLGRIDQFGAPRDFAVRKFENQEVRHSRANVRGGNIANGTRRAVRGNLQARGLRQAAHFTWEKAARETLAVYKALVL